MVALSFYNTQLLQTSSTMHSAKRKIEIHFYFWAKSRSSYLDRFNGIFLEQRKLSAKNFEGIIKDFLKTRKERRKRKKTEYYVRENWRF